MQRLKMMFDLEIMTDIFKKRIGEHKNHSTSQELLEETNALHRNLQFTLEKVDANGELSFLDMNMCVSKENEI